MAETAAVVGAGVSGLTAAHILRRSHDVTLFEAQPRAGGHAHTHDVPRADGAALPVDTGFMVFNTRNYPQLTRLFQEVGVRTQGSDMSMSLTCERCPIAYLTGSALRTAPACPDGFPAARWSRLADEARWFAALARGTLADPAADAATLGELLDAHGHSAVFADHLVLPLVSALWSCGAATARDYPARFLFSFLDHHGLLPGGAAVRWRTVTGGSRAYVRRVLAGLPDVRLGQPVRSVRRVAGGVEVRDARDRVLRYDRAVLAVHADQALQLLADPTAQEKAVLGAIPYVANEAVLHTDSSLLPAEERLRASWNMRRTDGDRRPDAPVLISYHLNRLQRLAGPVDYVVTLNPGRRVREERVIERMVYEHPVHTPSSVAARERLPGLNGPRLAFAGAYQGWAFHEDGCASGVRAAAALGSEW
ncbi:FAD-dependent oxidoreductase [Streptomyces pathocidini]|uniref:NAD(P)/FAD-dependent oxidoreductase n=1 Tax=Streptomyces pathocidini TaxID=1650571 RepID=UPI0033D2D704